MAQPKPRTKADKFAIAAALQEIGTLLELKGGKDRFKARAYKAGARIIAGLSVDIGELVRNDGLTSIRGIGDALASQIKQLYLTGSSSVLNKLREDFPPGVIELSGVPGLSISKIEKLHEALGIKSIADLKKAAEEGQIRGIKGFGEKTEQKLLETIATHRQRSESATRLHIHHAYRAAQEILDYLKTARGINEVSVAGSLRRWKETVGEIRIVTSSNKPASIIGQFLRYPLIVEVIDKSKTDCTVRLADGARVSLLSVLPEQYSRAFLLATGSDDHIERLRQISLTKGLEDLLQDADSRKIASETELYESLGMQYIPPELRENKGEIEAALKGKLPEDLVRLEDIQGMVHCHSTYSDGAHTIEQMARAAEAMGMKYLTITDHSPTAFYAGGVDLDKLKRQWDDIDAVQATVNVKLLKGTESDILANGSLDYPDSVLEKFDVIVASIHSRYKMDSEKMTKRIVTAMRQPVFKIWGHALGRLIQRRPPFECDIEQILDTIAESRAAIEINGDPYRLDMEPRWVREARKRKIRFVISVDAHSTGALNNVKYGVGIARRAWVRRGEVLNTLGTKSFVNAVRPV